MIANKTLKLSSSFNGNVQFITYYCHQTTPLGNIPMKPMVVIRIHEACELDLLKYLNVFCETEELILLLVTKTLSPQIRNAYLGRLTV